MGTRLLPVSTLRLRRLVACGSDVLIEGDAVERIHASVAQVLLALCAAVENTGHRVRLVGDAQRIRAALEIGGLSQRLPAASK